MSDKIDSKEGERTQMYIGDGVFGWLESGELVLSSTQQTNSVRYNSVEIERLLDWLAAIGIIRSDWKPA